MTTGMNSLTYNQAGSIIGSMAEIIPNRKKIETDKKPLPSERPVEEVIPSYNREATKAYIPPKEVATTTDGVEYNPNGSEFGYHE
jgi:hypothetical protein